VGLSTLLAGLRVPDGEAVMTIMSQPEPVGVDVGGQRDWQSTMGADPHRGWAFPDADERATRLLRSRERINKTRRIIARTSHTVDRTRAMKSHTGRKVDESYVEMAAQIRRLMDQYAGAWVPLPVSDDPADGVVTCTE
jgi:hypothetical protein